MLTYFLVIVSRFEVDDLKKFSCTEIQQQWGKLAEASLKAYEPQKIADLCHVKERILPYAKSTFSGLDKEFKDDIFQLILEGEL